SPQHANTLTTLAPSLQPLRIALITFSKRGLLVSISQVQLGVASLSLQNIGALRELSRLTQEPGLMLALTGRGLVLSIAIWIRHINAYRTPTAATAVTPPLSKSVEIITPGLNTTDIFGVTPEVSDAISSRDARSSVAQAIE